MSDRFEDLRTFVAVMSAGGINAAAAELGLAKSAVSRRISDLEGRLGVTLVSRTTRRFEPTRAGLEYFRRARGILASIEDLDGSSAFTLGWRRIVVSAPPSVVTHLLPAALANAVDGLVETVLKLVHAPDGAEADISIGTEPVAGRVNRDLATTVRITCASPHYLSVRGAPATPDELGGHVLIGVGEESAANWRFAAPHRGWAAITVAAPDEEAAAAAAVAGIGIVQLPDFVVAERVEAGSLVVILGDFTPEATRLIVSCDPMAEPAVRELFEALTAPHS